MTKSDYISSINAYDYLAPEYIEISMQKRLYLDSINKIIADNSPEIISNYLDAGCGDGSRSKVLIDKLKPENVVMIDNSPKMVELAKKLVGDVYLSSIADYKSTSKFDLITSLWNVFGHIESKEKRIESLKNLNWHLKDDGVLILDVNNRYNIDYGFFQVIKNIIMDLNIFKKDKSLGWYQFEHKGKQFSTYLHNFFEISDVLKQSGFSIIKFFSVGYNDGIPKKNNIFKGQLLFIVKKYGKKK